MNSGILLLTLNVFSATGGIEKVSRILGKALHEIDDDVLIYSMHDNAEDASEQYFPADHYRAFSANKTSFVLNSIRRGRNKNMVILTHINLLSVGYMIKMLSPKTKLVLLVHGIEVWKTFPGWKKKMLKHYDLILAVSHFTKDKMISMNALKGNNFHVLNNCLDPFLQQASTSEKNKSLLAKYGFEEDDKILMTLCRLSSSERYKGYDKVLAAMKDLNMPGLRYMIIGKYDAEEKFRLDHYISELGLKDKVAFTGYIPDREIADHYNLADLYIMPSEKEGFGIVFIEAMFYGKPVIAGNKDGSVDALANGELGTLVDPDNGKEISNAIQQMMASKASVPDRKKLNERFGYEQYKNHVESIIRN